MASLPSSKALKTLQLMFIVSVHDIPLWFLCRTWIMWFPGGCWICLAETKVGWCHVFHGLNRQRPSSDVKYIWADICNSAYVGLRTRAVKKNCTYGQATNWLIFAILLNTNAAIICQRNPKVFRWKRYPGWCSATCRLQRQTHNEDSSWRCDCAHVSAEVMVSHARQTWDQRSGNDDLGNQDLFRQYYRDKEMSEDDDPFLLIRGRFAERKGLLPPPLLRKWWGFHICVGSWRYDGTCILFGWRQGYRDLSFALYRKEELQSFISEVYLSSTKFPLRWFWTRQFCWGILLYFSFIFLLFLPLVPTNCCTGDIIFMTMF